MAIPYNEAFEFGDMNPVRDTSAKEYVYDNMQGSGIKATQRVISDSLGKRMNLTGPFKGIVLRVEKPEVREATAWDVRLETMMAANAGQETEGQTAAAGPPRPRLKVRIPELHSSLPIPGTLPEFSEPDKNHMIIDMYPTFIAKSNQALVPKAGDIVWVDFGNSLTQEDPVYLEPYLSNQASMLGGGGAFATAPSTSFGPGGGAGGASPMMVGDINGVASLGTPPICGDVCSAPGSSNWGVECLRVAMANHGFGERMQTGGIGNDAGAYCSMIYDVKHSNPHIKGNGGKPAGTYGGKRTKEKLIKYANDMHKKWGAWCGTFVAYCIMWSWVRAGHLPETCPIKVGGGTMPYGDYCRKAGSYGTPSGLIEGPGKSWKYWEKGTPLNSAAANNSVFDELLPGDILYWSRSFHAWKGHVAFCESWNDDGVWTLEGNLGKPGQSLVYRKLRPWPWKKTSQSSWSAMHNNNMQFRGFARLPQIVNFAGNTSPVDPWRAGPYDYYYLREIWDQQHGMVGGTPHGIHPVTGKQIGDVSSTGTEHDSATT